MASFCLEATIIPGHLRVKVYIPDYVLEIRGMVKLGRLSGEDLDISSWCISLSEKLFVYGSINLVEDMSAYSKR